MNGEEWKNYSLKDWQEILDQIKNYPLSLYVFIPFTYKFLGVNLIDDFFNLDGLSQEAESYIKDSIKGDFCFLCISAMDISIFKKGELTVMELLKLKGKLINEGGEPVLRIIYTGEQEPILVNHPEILNQ